MERREGEEAEEEVRSGGAKKRREGCIVIFIAQSYFKTQCRDSGVNHLFLCVCEKKSSVVLIKKYKCLFALLSWHVSECLKNSKDPGI